MEPLDPVGAGALTTLLARRADPGRLGDLLPLLGAPGLGSRDLEELAGTRGVLVLTDVGLPSTTPPLAAIAFDVDTDRRVARLVAIGVRSTVRRRGLGRRLVEGAAVLLCADGVERLEATVTTSTPAAAFLVAVGFRPDGDAGDAGHPATVQRLVRWL